MYIISIFSTFCVCICTTSGKLKRLQWSQWHNIRVFVLQPFANHELVKLGVCLYSKAFAIFLICKSYLYYSMWMVCQQAKLKHKLRHNKYSFHLHQLLFTYSHTWGSSSLLWADFLLILIIIKTTLTQCSLVKRKKGQGLSLKELINSISIFGCVPKTQCSQDIAQRVSVSSVSTLDFLSNTTKQTWQLCCRLTWHKKLIHNTICCYVQE